MADDEPDDVQDPAVRDDRPVESRRGPATTPPAVTSGPTLTDASWFSRRRDRKAAARNARRKAPWWEFPVLVVLAIGIAILVKTFVVQPFYIPSESMEKTLHGCPGCRGDRILVNKPIYDFRDPQPGDIVVFDAPKGWDEAVSHPPANPVLRAVRGFGQLVGFVPPDGQVLVKRVIAVGGQIIRGLKDGQVQVRSAGSTWRTLNEPYVFVDPGQPANPRAFGPVTVPAGRLWVMGDHRNDSADSRYHCGPDSTDDGQCTQYATEATVPVDNVIGKAFVIAWPPSRWRTLGTPTTFDDAAGSALPALGGAATVLPLAVVRRRRRTSRREPPRAVA